MRVKSVEFHEEADVEYERACGWYFARSERAAFNFVRTVIVAPVSGEISLQLSSAAVCAGTPERASGPSWPFS